MKTYGFISSGRFILTFLFFGLLLMSCAQKYEPISPRNETPQNRQDSLAVEFEWNYLLLSGYYFYADDELYDMEYYDVTPVTTDPYANITNMYEEMSDPFTQYFTPDYYEIGRASCRERV